MQEIKGQFTINETEILETYGYLFALMPKNQKRMLWIQGSIPLFVLFSLFYFRTNIHIGWIGFGVLIVFLWLGFFSRKIWNRFIMHQVQLWYKKNSEILQMTEVHFQFDNQIQIDQRSLDYSEIRQIIPLKHVLIFIIGDQDLFILPLRLFDSDQKIKEFSEMLKEKRGIENECL